MRNFSFFVACLGIASLTSVSAQIKIAPVPEDPHELVNGMADFMTSPQDRASAMALLERARQNSDMHMPSGAPFVLKMTFSVTSGSQTGQGTITETWLNGRQWRYDQSLGSYSESRVSTGGQIFAKHEGFTPMTVQMVRSSLFWPVGGNPSVSTMRTAQVSWNGKPATAILVSGSTEASSPGRHWVETEYVIDNASGLLQIYSRAPGTFAIYGYDQGMQFHGRVMPDHITIFTAGVQTVDAHLTAIQDPTADDAGLLHPDSEMQPAVNGSSTMNMRIPLQAHDPTNSGMLKQVIIHVTVDDQGNVVESELSAAADPALVEPALALVKGAKFGANRVDAYINVRFMP